MSFLYPRSITVWRLPKQDGVGAQGYIGTTEADLVQQGTPAATIAAAVQMKKESSSQPAKLAGDISKRVYWEILTAPGVQPVAFESNDIIKDDLGRQFQVVSAYLTAFGNWQCFAERLEA